jgi:hypothetical protein
MLRTGFDPWDTGIVYLNPTQVNDVCLRLYCPMQVEGLRYTDPLSKDSCQFSM